MCDRYKYQKQSNSCDILSLIPEVELMGTCGFDNLTITWNKIEHKSKRHDTEMKYLGIEAIQLWLYQAARVLHKLMLCCIIIFLTLVEQFLRVKNPSLMLLLLFFVFLFLKHIIAMTDRSLSTLVQCRSDITSILIKFCHSSYHILITSTLDIELPSDLHFPLKLERRMLISLKCNSPATTCQICRRVTMFNQIVIMVHS